jgi:hypothetical protein
MIQLKLILKYIHKNKLYYKLLMMLYKLNEFYYLFIYIYHYMVPEHLFKYSYAFYILYFFILNCYSTFAKWTIPKYDNPSIYNYLLLYFLYYSKRGTTKRYYLVIIKLYPINLFNLSIIS